MTEINIIVKRRPGRPKMSEEEKIQKRLSRDPNIKLGRPKSSDEEKPKRVKGPIGRPRTRTPEDVKEMRKYYNAQYYKKTRDLVILAKTTIGTS